MVNYVNLRINRHLRVLFILVVATVLTTGRAAAQLPDVSDLRQTVGPKPGPAPTQYLGLIGEYGTVDATLIVLEQGGRLLVQRKSEADALRELSRNAFEVIAGPRTGQRVVFTRAAGGRATKMQFGELTYPRRTIEQETG